MCASWRVRAGLFDEYQRQTSMPIPYSIVRNSPIASVCVARVTFLGRGIIRASCPDLTRRDCGLRITFVIFGLTIQKVGKRLELRCPECTVLSGRLGLIREERPRLKLFCRHHPDICGVWNSEAEMEDEKLALAKRIGLT